jgi:hypothetical protein
MLYRRFITCSAERDPGYAVGARKVNRVFAAWPPLSDATRMSEGIKEAKRRADECTSLIETNVLEDFITFTSFLYGAEHLLERPPVV